MNPARTARFAVDLFAFWNEAAWDLPSIDDVAAMAGRDPRAFWDRLLARLSDSGVDAFEITFAPFDWRTLLLAYGDVAGVSAALDRHGLSICGAYLPALEQPASYDGGGRAGLLAEAREVSAFLGEIGGATLIGSLPLRTTRGSADAVFIDLATAQRYGALAQEVGRIAYSHGIRFGLHTESHSALWLERDIDLFMLATDPFYVGLCPDAAHSAMGGGDPVAVARRHRTRLVAAHWKDTTGPLSWELPIGPDIHALHRSVCVLPGEGIVDWAAWTEQMRAANLLSPLIIEVEASATPEHDIRAALRHLAPIVGSDDKTDPKTTTRSTT